MAFKVSSMHDLLKINVSLVYFENLKIYIKSRTLVFFLLLLYFKFYSLQLTWIKRLLQLPIWKENFLFKNFPECLADEYRAGVECVYVVQARTKCSHSLQNKW